MKHFFSLQFLSFSFSKIFLSILKIHHSVRRLKLKNNERTIMELFKIRFRVFHFFIAKLAVGMAVDRSSQPEKKKEIKR